MKSSTGQYWAALDHVRAIAALLVVIWHFVHKSDGSPVPFEQAPLPPFSLLEEGHVGVALFMVLSGYLFTKLLAGREIVFHLFLWNRAIRLLPLLAVTLVLWGVRTWLTGGDLPAYLWSLVTGFVLPTWPYGCWSIAVELHFYILLPALLVILRHKPLLMLVVVAFFMLVRATIFAAGGDTHYLAYFTIIGRFDQFAFGMLAYIYRDKATPAVIGGGLLAFLAYQWAFNWAGGFDGLQDSAIWIINPTVEAMACAGLIAWYDGLARPIGGRLGKWLAKAGEYSYSIYLLHLFFILSMANFIHTRVMDISNFYLALPWALAAFVMLMGVGFVSYTWIEKRLERFRVSYSRVRSPSLIADAPASAVALRT